jgi:hypothetical protein
MFGFLKKIFKKDEENSGVGTEISVELPSVIEIESIDNYQSGGGKKYYDNIYSRNLSKL